MKKILIAMIPDRLPNYKDAVVQCGGEAVEMLDLPESLEEFGGLLIPGGGDIEPWRYGKEPEPDRILSPMPELDEKQLALIDAFVKAQKPILGICRGHQLLHVYFGGALCQHIPQADRHIPVDGVDQAHGARAEPGSWLAGIYGEEFPVNSCHHQAVETPGKGMKTVLWSDDGVLEGSAHETLPIWTVQYHPERMCFARRRADTVDGALLFRFFLEQL